MSKSRKSKPGPANPLEAELAGINLVEASAGTGKTYTITGLFLRCLVERRLAVDQILVVTFTEAATDELRGRVRTLLRRAVQAFKDGKPGEEAIRVVLDRVPEAERKDVILLLEGALHDFDRAAIFTIHGFCNRILHENAFESGVTFDAELVTDDSEVFGRLARDFWRIRMDEASELFVRFLHDRGTGPDSLARLARHHGSLLNAKVVPAPAESRQAADEEEEGNRGWRGLRGSDTTAAAGSPAPEQEARVRKLRAELGPAWRRDRAAIVEMLRTAVAAGILHKGVYGGVNEPDWFDEVDDFVWSAGSAGCAVPRAFERLAAGTLEKKTNKGGGTPRHAFFDLAQAFLDALQALDAAYEAALVPLKREFLEYLEREYHRLREEQHVFSFDDLLRDVHHALRGDGGEALAAALRSQYPVALIDEFQDTDPIQFEIFRAVYGGQEEATAFFLVGDPKQSIYAFRGADIFSYRSARESAGRQIHLQVNRRSEERLIRALNTLFGRARVRKPFLFDWIEYQKVQPPPAGPGSSRPPPVTVDGKADAPFQLWYLERPPLEEEKAATKSISKEKARWLIYSALAAEVVRLVNGGQKRRILIGDKPVEPGDIAVIVRTHWQADDIQAALRRQGVGSVIYSGKNVMQSVEVEELEQVLSAVARWRDAGLLRAALLTELLGVTIHELDALMRSDEAWEARQSRFLEYHELWRDAGFIQMFRALLAREDIPSRLLAFPDGERRLTNLFHAGELLQSATVTENLGISGLLRWLADERRRAGGDDAHRVVADERQIRLESDEKRVKIVTVHFVKGLEFPITFCPMLWEGRGRGRHDDELGRTLFFHDPDDRYRPVVDLGSGDWDAHEAIGLREEMAERLRLAYVALTRAKNRCYAVVGPVSSYDTSGLAYLLHQPEGKAAADPAPISGEAVAATSGRRGSRRWPESAATGGNPHGVFSASPEIGADPAAAVAERVKGLTDEALAADLESLAKEADGSVAVTPLSAVLAGKRTQAEPPEAAPVPALEARRFTGRIDREWAVASFSSLSRRRIEAADEGLDRDHHDFSPEAPRTGAGRTMADFPRGAAPGTLIHSLFEELDFTASEERIREVCAEQLRVFRYSADWEDVLVRMVQDVLGTALDGADLRLGTIPSGRCLKEVEFYYPLGRLGDADLNRFFREQKIPVPFQGFESAIGRLQFSPVKGFMKGYMDLVVEHRGRYYLADYKSNWLGSSPEDYAGDRLGRAMIEGQYVLQYSIYAVALHRYLASRMPKTYRYADHFGGVFYLFVRGMDPVRGGQAGVFFDRPDEGLVGRLSDFLDKGRRTKR